MAKHTPLTLAAILLATTVAAASAQTTQDHAAHHPAESAQAAGDATAPPLPGCPSGTTAMGKNGGGMPMNEHGLDDGRRYGSDDGRHAVRRRWNGDDAVRAY